MNAALTDAEPNTDRVHNVSLISCVYPASWGILFNENREFELSFSNL